MSPGKHTGMLRAFVMSLSVLVCLMGGPAGAADPKPTPPAKASRPAADDHWAYRRPVRPPLPAVGDAKWPRNPIDHFVLARLEQEGLKPSPPADRAALIRRVSLDLIGLPPTVAEVDTFLADKSPGAYEKVVDRLLASPHYGERWARPWLDLARYADTNGYHVDTRRDVWLYRDWVINSLNADKPFDQFTVEQIAGDMLPGATVEQKIATGFHRNTMFNEEGGIDPEEFRVKAVVDRVDTTATVWLGATLACAECHDHKYDPVSQKEYFQFYAFLNNTPDTGGGTGTARVPLLQVPTPEQQAQLAKHRAEIAEAEKVLNAATPELAAAQKKWEASAAAGGGGSVAWTVLDPVTSTSAGGATLTKQPDHSLLAGGARPDVDTYTIVAHTDLENITAVRLEALSDESLPNKGPGRQDNGNFVLTEFAVTAAPKSDPAAARPLALANASADFSQENWTAALAINGNGAGDNGWAVHPQIGTSHAAVFELKDPAGSKGGTVLTFTLDQRHGTQHLIGRPRLSVTSAPRPVAATTGALPANITAALAMPAAQRSEQQKTELAAHYRSIAPELQPAREGLAAARKAEAAVLAAAPSTMVMEEMPQPRKTRVHRRGNFLDPGEEVTPAVPAVLHPLPPGKSANRLGLAYWLVDEKNPLVGRVTMNRAWETFFGRGIVETSEDFGVQGLPPSHPQLLDWLATEFVRRKWSQKAMHRLIVTSATYRQSSRVTPALLERDLYNRLLARGPRFRMEAEMIRDNALAAADMLVRKVGGPSVYPPQPPGLWIEIGNPDYGMAEWPASSGDDVHRRGLYTFWRRSIPYPSFTTFDAPAREHCTARRARTNTPLQALVTLNDPAYVEAARALAVTMVAKGGPKPEARAAHGFRRCVARSPKRHELRRLVELYEQQLKNFSAAPEKAAAVLKGTAPPASVEARELAAWTVVANVLLNLDETITKQ